MFSQQKIKQQQKKTSIIGNFEVQLGETKHQKKTRLN
jgi:hypothetical protein